VVTIVENILIHQDSEPIKLPIEGLAEKGDVKRGEFYMKLQIIQLFTIILLLLIGQTKVFAIANEKEGGIAERIFKQYEDPDITLRSYAMVDFGCSGTMIGPNTLLTAAHCYDKSSRLTINFRVYSPETEKQFVESYTCTYLTHSWPDTDIILYDCPANAKGENPGDIYGYLDFEISFDHDGRVNPGPPNEGESLYSVWTNPITSLKDSIQHMLYSKGTVTNNEADFWASPGKDDPKCGGKERRKIGVSTDLWSQRGASGSSQISPSTHRLVLGPQSTGQLDKKGRNQLSISDYLYWGWAQPEVDSPDCKPGTQDAVNQTYLSSLNIENPERYYGFIDKELDGFFDIQHDLELMRGETERDWMWLGFESMRRNALWTQTTYSDFDTSNSVTGIARLARTRNIGKVVPDYWTALSHNGLELVSQTKYRVSFMIFVDRTGNSKPLQVCLGNGGTDCVKIAAPKGRWVTRVAEFVASDENSLRFDLAQETVLALAAVSIIANDAVMDFDSHDARYNWRNQDTGTRGLIWPEGRKTTEEDRLGTPDWAGVVKHNKLSPESWSLRNRQLAIKGGYEYQVCFHHRESIGSPLETNVTGMARIVNERGAISESSVSFEPSNNYQEDCSNWFYVPTDDNNLQFGTLGYQYSEPGIYFVDDITIHQRPF
jgi:Trypsin